VCRDIPARRDLDALPSSQVGNVRTDAVESEAARVCDLEVLPGRLLDQRPSEQWGDVRLGQKSVLLTWRQHASRQQGVEVFGRDPVYCPLDDL
jgi:hypothetical protein